MIEIKHVKQVFAPKGSFLAIQGSCLPKTSFHSLQKTRIKNHVRYVSQFREMDLQSKIKSLQVSVVF